MGRWCSGASSGRPSETGAGTAAQVVESLEMVAASAIEMYKKDSR